MLSSAEITAWLTQVLWPLFRIAAALWFMPLFGGRGVPRHARLALAVALAIFIAPRTGPLPVVEALSAQGLLITLEQLLIGLGFALILRLLFTVFTMAGQIMSMQMGLAMAVMNDPSTGSVPLLGSWLKNLTFVLFLAMNGHLVIFQVLLESFTTLPIGAGLNLNDFLDIALLGSWLFSGALLVSLLAVFSMLLVNVGFGVMSRAAPQLNIFSLGFPMTMLFGMATLFLVLVNMPALFTDLAEQTLGLLRSFMSR